MEKLDAAGQTPVNNLPVQEVMDAVGESADVTFPVNMERLTADGVHLVTGWGHVNSTEKVSALFDRTDWFKEWRTYRVAYGRQKGWNNPSFVKWAQPMTVQYDPTIQELFSDITLEARESYFLLISRLDVNNLHTASRKDVEHAISRFPNLYTAPPVSDVLQR